MKSPPPEFDLSLGDDLVVEPLSFFEVFYRVHRPMASLAAIPCLLGLVLALALFLFGDQNGAWTVLQVALGGTALIYGFITVVVTPLVLLEYLGAPGKVTIEGPTLHLERSSIWAAGIDLRQFTLEIRNVELKGKTVNRILCLCPPGPNMHPVMLNQLAYGYEKIDLLSSTIARVQLEYLT